MENITTSGGIPRTLRNCTFNIRFENGGRGCVRLAEALLQDRTQNIVTSPKNHFFENSVKNLIIHPSLLSADAGNYIKHINVEDT